MRLEIPTPAGAAIAELDRPRAGLRALLVLTHGAGGGIDTGDLLAIRAAAVRSGIAVARVVQPYRAAGRRTPASPDKQDEGWLAIVGAIRRRRGLAQVPLVVGGRSNGARVACRTATACGAAGVLALAFPLHPPGRAERSRLPELDGAGVPTLVVQGDRDAFGMPPAGPQREVVVIAGADHGLKRDLPVIAQASLDWFGALIGSSAAAAPTARAVGRS